MMAVGPEPRPTRSEFAVFVREVEPRLLQALVSAYGPRDGREATVDALSWAWEHWDRLGQIDNQLHAWSLTSGLWDPLADRRKTAVRVLGALAMLAGEIGRASCRERVSECV